MAARRRGGAIKDDGWRMYERPMKADCPPASSFRPSAALRRRRFPTALCCGCCMRGTVPGFLSQCAAAFTPLLLSFIALPVSTRSRCFCLFCLVPPIAPKILVAHATLSSPASASSTTSTSMPTTSKDSTTPTTTASTPATSTANANSTPASATSPAAPTNSALTTPGYSTHHSHHTPAHLSISLDTPPSASPFPSPSSSFLPPPIPGAHEFAMKDVPVGRKGGSAAGGAGKDVEGAKDADAGASGVNGVELPRVFAPTAPISSLTSNAAAPSVTIGTATATSALTPSPATPTPANAASNATSSSSSATTTSALTPTATPTPSTPTTPSAKRVSFSPSATAALGLKSHSNSNSPAWTPTSLVLSLDEEGGLPRTPTPSSSRPAPPSPTLSPHVARTQ
ncbi:hypothetical protein C8R47DRAFT_1152378 [Mycena vitilis]|nr:hypothetical protein C8R47DRAFT_1152378 [Mycena vitilis]